MRINLIEHITTSGAPNLSNVKSVSNPTVTFFAYGIGSGSWSAVIKIAPVIDQAYISSEPLSITISNTSNNISTTVTTGMREFVGWVESVSGTVDLNVIGSF